MFNKINNNIDNNKTFLKRESVLQWEEPCLNKK